MRSTVSNFRENADNKILQLSINCDVMVHPKAMKFLGGIKLGAGFKNRIPLSTNSI